MTLKIRDAGTLRTITGAQVKVAGVMRTIREIKVQDGGALRTVAIFATALSPSISSTRTETSITPGNFLIEYDATATPGGGLGPYTYSWAIVSGSGWTVQTPSSATTKITGGTGSGDATARVTVTDSLGQTDTADLALTD